MRNTLLTLTISAALLLWSCHSKKEEKQIVQSINVNDIHVSEEIIHDSLTADQINKIKRIQATFAEVDPVTLEESITDFKKDPDPDSEIKIWLEMANAYEKYLKSKHGKLGLNAKKEVYNLILLRSMMPGKEAIENAKLKILTEKETSEILSYYTLPPEPLDVVKKP